MSNSLAEYEIDLLQAMEEEKRASEPTKLWKCSCGKTHIHEFSEHHIRSLTRVCPDCLDVEPENFDLSLCGKVTGKLVVIPSFDTGDTITVWEVNDGEGRPFNVMTVLVEDVEVDNTNTVRVTAIFASGTCRMLGTFSVTPSIVKIEVTKRAF